MCNSCDARFLQVMRSYQDGGGRRDFMRGMGALAAIAAAAGNPLEVLAKTKTTDLAKTADLIFISNTIHTVDAKNSVVQAIAVRQGKIIAVGSRKDVIVHSGRHTQVIDFGDRVVLPGFVEPHMHSNFSGLRPWLDVGPFTTANMQEALGKIKQFAASTAQTWVQAKMLDPSIMPGAPITRADLDRVSPNLPVFVLESNGHVAYVNSLAMKLAGVSKETPDPPQARFMRGADGELTGRLEEPNAFQPFITTMPSPSPEDMVKLLRADIDDASSKGCTTLHDAGIGTLFAEADLALIDAVMAGNPGVRYAGFLVSTHFKKWTDMKLRPGVRSRRFTLNGIKAWADGSNQGLTGFQRSPYLGTTNRGALNYTPQEIEAVIRQAHEANWQIGVHANGDAAIDTVLDAFERVAGPSGARKLRHRIEPGSLTRQSKRAIRWGCGRSRKPGGPKRIAHPYSK